MTRATRRNAVLQTHLVTYDSMADRFFFGPTGNQEIWR